MAPTTQIYPGIPITSNGGMIPSEHPQPFPKELPTDPPRPTSPKISSDSIKLKKWGPVRWQVPEKGLKWKKGYARFPKDGSDDSDPDSSSEPESDSNSTSSAGISSAEGSSASNTSSRPSPSDVSDLLVDDTKKLRAHEKKALQKNPATRSLGTLNSVDIPGNMCYAKGDMGTSDGNLIPDSIRSTPELAKTLAAQHHSLASWSELGFMTSSNDGTGSIRTDALSSSGDGVSLSPPVQDQNRPCYRPKSKIKLHGSDETCVTQTDEGVYDKKGRQVGAKRTWVTHVRIVVVEEEMWAKV